MENPFHTIPQGPHGHFLLHFYGAILRVLSYIDRTDALSSGLPHEADRRYQFLDRYRQELERFIPRDLPLDAAIPWWEEQVTGWQTAASGHLPLAALESLAPVGCHGRAVFMLAGLVEEDSRFGTVFAHLQEPLTARRLTLGLVSQLLAPGNERAELDAWEICRGLFESGALETSNPATPRSEWMLHAPSAVWDAARGSLQGSAEGWFAIHAQEEFAPLDRLILPDAFLARLRQVPAMLRAGKIRAMVLRSTPGSDRLRVAGAVAQAIGRQVIEVISSPPLPEAGDPAASEERRDRALGMLCVLANAMPVYSFDLGPGETARLPELRGYPGPIAVLMGFEGGLRGSLVERSLTLSLPLPDLALRMRHWQTAVGDTPIDDLERIAARFILPGGYIRQTATIAIAQASLEGREGVTLDDVRLAARALNRQMLDNLADRVDATGAWSQLVASSGTLSKLRELQRRCTYRERLLDHLGSAFGSTANRGVRALFSGASGTGKTLAARVLAAELGMDLYRVDLASVINKYIGETEKNLHRVLSRAEELDIILLLDEGDALLGSRTDVKSSNDRYANLETNYLLQRLEHYQGIVLVTTNAAQNIDTAFQRRMDVVVTFVPPQADERWAIWQLHLPAYTAVRADFLDRVAAQCDLTGGQIRNAALLATLLSVSEGSSGLQDRHLAEAVRAEYRKAGAVCPLEESAGPVAASSQMEQFIHILS